MTISQGHQPRENSLNIDVWDDWNVCMKWGYLLLVRFCFSETWRKHRVCQKSRICVEITKTVAQQTDSECSGFLLSRQWDLSHPTFISGTPSSPVTFLALCPWKETHNQSLFLHRALVLSQVSRQSRRHPLWLTLYKGSTLKVKAGMGGGGDAICKCRITRKNIQILHAAITAFDKCFAVSQWGEKSCKCPRLNIKVEEVRLAFIPLLTHLLRSLTGP